MLEEWQGRTGQSWADEWRRTDRSFGMLTERLLQRTREFRFNEVVDVGCGAGELSLAVARGRPGVQVTGVDVSPPLVAAARERGENLANVAFEVADAETASRGYVLQTGSIIASGECKDLQQDARVHQAYLGRGAA